MDERRGPQQSSVGANTMRYYTHEDDADIPVGFATLVIDNNGWVGTNSGWPHAGQPALYPIAQAEAIAIAWNLAVNKPKLPDNIYWPMMLSEEARNWLRWTPSAVEAREASSAVVCNWHVDEVAGVGILSHYERLAGTDEL